MNLSIKVGGDRQDQNAYIVGLCASVILALITFRIFTVQVSGFIDHSAIAAFGVTEGITDWRAYQNRILGPYAVLLVSKIGLTYQTALVSFAMAITVLNVVVLYILFHKITGSVTKSLLRVQLFCLVFLFLQQDVFFIWDSLDLLVFSVFSYFAIFACRLTFLVPLFFLSLLNRESALFISLFIILDSFDFTRLATFRLVVLDRAKLAIGIGLMAIGLAYTKLSRDILFVDTLGGKGDLQHALIGNHIQFRWNAKNFLVNNWFDWNILHNTLILGSILFLAVKFRSFDGKTRKLTVFSALMMLNITMFGLINETRVLLPFLPLFLFWWLYLGDEKPVLAASADEV